MLLYLKTKTGRKIKMKINKINRFVRMVNESGTDLR